MNLTDDSLPLLDEAQAAEELGFARRTLKEWRQRGVGPEVVLIGRSVRYTRPALRRFILERQRGPSNTRSKLCPI